MSTICIIYTLRRQKRDYSRKSDPQEGVYIWGGLTLSHSLLWVAFPATLTLAPSGFVRNNHFAYPLNDKLVQDLVLRSPYRDFTPASWLVASTTICIHHHLNCRQLTWPTLFMGISVCSAASYDYGYCTKATFQWAFWEFDGNPRKGIGILNIQECLVYYCILIVHLKYIGAAYL